MDLLRLDGIHTYYGKSHVLRGVHLEVKNGEIVALLGRNGVGKTTTVNTIMGFVKARAGRIIFKEQDIKQLPTHAISGLGIGYVPQGRRLFPRMTVLENLKTGMIRGGGKGALERVLELFPNLRSRLHQRAGSLSGGEQQALAISRAILMEPELLLLDEPTTGLMPIFVNTFQDIIRRLNHEGIAILLIEEKVPFALALAHRVNFMVKGKIEYVAAKEDLEGSREVFLKYLGVEA
ncbi:MAG: ABC transporter ATP-binding protein [Thermodesulfobacteriota bacterium]